MNFSFVIKVNKQNKDISNGTIAVAAQKQLDISLQSALFSTDKGFQSVDFKMKIQFCFFFGLISVLFFYFVLMIILSHCIGSVLAQLFYFFLLHH